VRISAQAPHRLAARNLPITPSHIAKLATGRQSFWCPVWRAASICSAARQLPGQELSSHHLSTAREDDCFALRQPFQLSDLVSDLAEFIDWQCLESPTVFGVSFGGVLALEYAARYGHRLDRLIVQGAGARFEHTLLQAVAGTVLNRFPLPADNPFINQFFNLLFGGRQKRNALFHFVTSQCWQTDQSVMAHRMRLVESFDVSSRLHRIRVPSLILAGEKDVLVPPRSLAVLRDGIDDSQIPALAQLRPFGVCHPPRAGCPDVHTFLADEVALAAI